MSSPILSKASNHQNHPPSLSPISRSLNIGRSSTDPLSPKTPTRSTCPDQDLSLNLDDAEADLNITAESSFGGATFGDEDGMSEERQPKHTPHNWPTWLTDLKRDFSVLVVNQCSGRVRRAVDKNEKIQVWIVILEFHLNMSRFLAIYGCPVSRLCLVPGQPAHLNLEDDCLGKWKCFLWICL